METSVNTLSSSDEPTSLTQLEAGSCAYVSALMNAISRMQVIIEV